MEIYTASDARSKLYKLIDYVSEAHEPICITGKRNKAIMISEADFKSIQETIYLLSIPGMKESLLQGMSEPIENCTTQLDW
jgi:antitoxin YefM